MPSYNFRNKDTGEEWTEFMSMSEQDTFLETNPHIEYVPSFGTPFIDTVKLGRTKPADGFRELLGRIHKRNPGSNINLR